MMVSRRSGPPGGIILILLLFIQGNYGKSLVGHALGDAGEASSIGDQPHDEDKKEDFWLRTKFLSGAHHRDYEGKDFSSSRTTITGAHLHEYEGKDNVVNITNQQTSLLQTSFITGAHRNEYEGKDNVVNITYHQSSLLQTSFITEAKSRAALSGSWNDRMKEILVGITGLIPPIEGIPIGKIVSVLLKAFWPASKPDIWSLIKDQVAKLIDQSILEYELQERNNEIRALQRTMQMYVEAHIREKGSLMSTMVHACNELFFKLTQSKNSVQLIPLVVTHSIQHLLILKERLLHGKEMYDDDNTPVWRKDLEQQISTYKDFIKDIYSKWVEWRNSKIIVEVGAPAKPITIPPFVTWIPYGKVHDEMSNDEVRYSLSALVGPNNDNYFRPICEAVKKKMFGFRNGEMLQILVTTFYLDNFIPGNEDNPSVIPSAMSIASFGPMSPYTDGGDESSHLYSPGDDNRGGGDVTSINVREWNIIDGFQVVYSTGAGTFYGNSGGGKLHEIPLNNRRVKSIKFCYNNCNQVEVTIGFSNGQSTGRLGNRGRWRVYCVDTGGIDTYGLYNIRATDYGCAKGLFQIAADYKAYPVRPSEIDKQKLYLVDFTTDSLKYKSVIDAEKTE